MTDPSPTTVAQDYPPAVNIEYPAARKRWSVLARLPLGLPVVFFSLLLNIGATLATWGAILASGRISSWLFAFQVTVGRWYTRSGARGRGGGWSHVSTSLDLGVDSAFAASTTRAS